MSSRVFTRADVEAVISWQGTLRDPDFMCSSWAEICPWYRRGLGYLNFARILKSKIGFRQACQIFVTNAKNLLRRSYMASASPALPSEMPADWLVTWAISDSDTLQSCITRYFGQQDAEDIAKKSVFPCVLFPFQPKADTVQRFIDEGALIIFEAPFTIRAFLRMVIQGVKMGSIAVLDAEFWRGMQIASSITDWIEKNKLRQLKVRLPYEQQPWQLKLIYELRRRLGRSVTIIGDVHSSTTNFPVQFSRLAIAPDALVVHGSAYKRVLVDFLGWDAAAVSCEPSRRFRRKLQLSQNTIFLPYDFVSAERILEEVAAVLKVTAFPPLGFDIRIHPARASQESHQYLLAALRKLTADLSSHAPPLVAASAPLVVITVGVSTTLLEALESGYAAFGVYENPYFEAYSPEIWQELACTWISNSAVSYQLASPRAFVIYADRAEQEAG